ncbi:NADH-quinone oxidoreductase subunit N [wastewater metagenome]|uniref:NADH-quinone oxidoreductase subunit N n=2 Tax=unclassified sequences TaxID=12908 RepID=A0A5B8R7Y0_9ZZZZ|nr:MULTISPECIES: NADH-quinone oxidoreductase subunit NuoN [Arhodomonas]MCS4504665.1 NADH-quinone oxidoreductase subunit NuoN [Arhodomonas aquaeolei]QEA04068.1 NADH-quinone oxidoreductase subunit N [uncultured organism]
MSFVIPNFSLALPEIWLLAMICVVLVADLFATGRESAPAFYLSQIALLGAMWFAVQSQWGVDTVDFNGTYVADSLAATLKVSIAGFAFLAFAYSRDYLRQRNLLRGEFYLIGLFAVLGGFVMSSSGSMLTLYLGLELMSLALYAMVAFDRDSRIASEAAMKYFVLGALSSGMLLYGMSMIYGGSGSLELAEIAAQAAGGPDNMLLAFGLTFALVGVAFKFGAVPFHMWVPDVYQGAATPTSMFIGTVSKVAAVPLFLRLVAEGLGALHGDWQVMATFMAVASLAVGSLFALVQDNFKRLLAYSTVAHIGFLFLGFIAGTEEGYAASLFYAISYALMSAAAFGMIMVLSRRGHEADEIADLRGLNDRSTGMALVMLVVMFSMTGVPGTVGFYSKWAVLKAVIDTGHVWLAVVAVLFAVISAFYYLRVLKAVYFERIEGEAEAIPASATVRWVCGLNGVAILGLGLFPGALFAVCRAAFGG